VISAARAGAVVAACEAIAVLLSAGAERGIVAPAVAASLLVEIALAAAIGLAGLRFERAEGAVAWAVALLFAGMFVAANGIVPAVPDRHALVAPAIVLAVVACAIGAAARRRRPDERLAPLIAGPALIAAVCAARALHLEPGWTLVAALAVAFVVAGAIGLAVKRPTWSTGASAALGLSTLVACLAFTSRAPAIPPRAAGPPDVLLVVLDTVRADAVPAPSGARFPTPELARLAAEGTRHAAAFSTSCWTVPAHASLFTGWTAREHATGWESPYLTESAETLAETLARVGYRTAGYSANVWISPEFGFDRGFSRFLTLSASDRPLAPWPLRAFRGAFARWDATLPFDDKGGSALTRAALSFLAEEGRPAFVFVNLLEAHMPYAPPERFLRGLAHDELLGVPQIPLAGLTPETTPSAGDLDAMRLLYAAEVAYDDLLLARLLEPLRRAGRLDDTIVVVASDHGENLGDHPPLDHQLGLWDSLVRVPLIVRYPRRIAAGRTDEALVSLADVRGLILSLATGADPPPPRDLVPLAYDRPGEILERIRALGVDPAPWDRRLDAVRTAEAKWIAGSDGARYAFDLSADSGERRNLADTGGFETLAARLDAWIAATQPAEREPAKPINDETRRRLRSLGYVH
jgi:arylsulfatase A-like enzyme